MPLNSRLHLLAHNGDRRLEIRRPQRIGRITQSPQWVVTLSVADSNSYGFPFRQSNFFFRAVHQPLEDSKRLVRVAGG